MPHIPVRLTKLRECPSPKLAAGAWSSYVPGSALNPTSLPVDYELEGLLHQAPAPGQTMSVLRTKRNGIAVPGIFESSAIQTVFVVTENSVYRLERLAPPGQPDSAQHDES